MKARNTQIKTVIRELETPGPQEAAALTALCVRYGDMLSVFLNGLQSRELRQDAMAFRGLRDRLVAALKTDTSLPWKGLSRW